MSSVRHDDVLLRVGGVCLQKYGRPWWRGPYDRNEPDTYTLTRADSTTCATIVDSDLTIRKAAAGKLRCSWYDTDSDGVADVCGLLLESSRANLCLQSEDFSTTWSAGGTPTRSGGAATCGCVSLDLIGDDSAAALEYYAQDVTFTGDAVKAFSVIVVRGTSTSSVFRLIDSAASVKLLATLTWNGNVPSLAMTTGTHLRTVALASTTYRLEFQTASVTAANPVTIQVFPATTAALATANTGNLYCGAVMAENAPYPSSYIKTTTATVTRAADALSFPIGFAPEDLTVFAKIVRPAWADASGTLGVIPPLFDIAGSFYVVGASAARNLTLGLSDNAHANQEVSAAIPAGTTISVCAQASAWSTGVTGRFDVGGGFGSYTTPQTSAVSTWPAGVGNLVYPGGTFGGTSQQGVLLLDLIVARGLFTYAEMAAAAAAL